MQQTNFDHSGYVHHQWFRERPRYLPYPCVTLDQGNKCAAPILLERLDATLVMIAKYVQTPIRHRPMHLLVKSMNAWPT